MTRGGPEVVRREFLNVTGREDLLDAHTGKEVEIHLPHDDETLSGVTIWFRNGDQLRDFVDRAEIGGFQGLMLAAVAQTLPRRRTARHRRRAREASTVARVLAIHYLSRAGGGERTLEAAAELYRTTFETLLDENRRAGRRRPPGWHALPDGWRAERSRVIAELRDDFGAL